MKYYSRYNVLAREKMCNRGGVIFLNENYKKYD